jgi:hypothetical protein
MRSSQVPDIVAEDLFGAALLDPEQPAPSGLVGPDGKPAPKRFNVYRNNVIVSLTEALGETFPAIKSLLGEEFFNALARAFVSVHPPKSPVLIWYGGEFPGFIEAFPPLAAYPYLGDVARVEWAWVQAFHAEDAVPLDPSALADIAPEKVGACRFVRHPAADVLSSDWPVWDLLRANRFEHDSPIGIDLDEAQSVLVSRPALDVELVLLRPGADCFLEELFGGADLAVAAMSAQERNGDFSLSDSLSDCLSKGAFARLSTDETD